MFASDDPYARRMAWRIVALLAPVAMLNYLDRQMLASMKFSIAHDLSGLTDQESWGRILAAFKWVYALSSPLGGFLADRFSRRWVITASLLIWPAVTWATGQVATAEQLLFTRALMGLSEAFYIPAALALIADFHPSTTRSRAIGVHQMGIYAGVILGGLGGYAADSAALGWRGAFELCGIVGVLYAILLALFLRDAPSTEAPSKGRTSPGASLKELFGNRSFVLLVLCFTLPALSAWIVRDWMPAVLKEQFGIGQGRAGISATLPWQAAAIFGALGGGWLADRWMRRTIRGRIYVSALGMALFLPALAGLGYAPSTGHLSVAILFLVVFGVGWGFFDCNTMPVLCQVARPDLRATGYGMMNFISIGCGGFADWGFGRLRDHGVALAAILGLLAAAALLSIFCMLLIQPRTEAAE
ncbi:MAG TPA: MFS transporter [Pirellulales bacterium]|nr:MFS transporter [Pirellulales bacterium]